MREWIDNQWQNLFLYVPFLMACGAALYFSLNHEPDFICTEIITVCLAIGIIWKRIPNMLRAILLFLFGFYYAATFTHIIDTPQLKKNLHNITFNGNVTHIEYKDQSTQLHMNVNASDIGAGDGRANIRISVPDDTNKIKIGDTVQIHGGLFRPSDAYAPETFDYARWAYFNNLSATGYATDLKIINTTNRTTLRDNLHKNTNSMLADTLVLGYKNAIPKQQSEIWNATGIGHVWSISGFHMTLVGGWLFAFFYFIFRSIPYTTRRYPAKIPAIICAWAGLGAYLFLSGNDIATMRAFLMSSLVFSAFIFGRTAISLRNVALAFCVIFLINPHYVMQAGFQLSFAAVFGIVWLFSVVKPKMPRNKILKIIYVALLTSVVATIFTAPFVAIHFGRLPTYTLIGNLLLLPVFSIAIMPLVLIGTITACVGFRLPLDMAQSIYNWLYNMAEKIANIPYATIYTPQIPNSAIILFIIGFICLICIKPIKIKLNYILFMCFICLGLIATYTTQAPVFYATHDHELVAFRNDDGILEFNKSRASNHFFAFDTWKQLNRQPTNTKNIRRKHDNGVYKYNTEKFNLVYIQKFVPLMKNIEQLCQDKNVDYIVSYFNINSEKCNHKILTGGILIKPDGKIIRTPSGRPWHRNRRE